jgi:hypothetical protein
MKMNTKISTVIEPDPRSDAEQELLEIAETFFTNACVDAVACMESMLVEWYQYYAPEHCDNDHIDEVVNTTFKVNELLLKLQEVVVKFCETDARVAVDRDGIIQPGY